MADARLQGQGAQAAQNAVDAAISQFQSQEISGPDLLMTLLNAGASEDDPQVNALRDSFDPYDVEEWQSLLVQRQNQMQVEQSLQSMENDRTAQAQAVAQAASRQAEIHGVLAPHQEELVSSELLRQALADLGADASPDQIQETIASTLKVQAASKEIRARNERYDQIHSTIDSALAEFQGTPGDERLGEADPGMVDQVSPHREDA